MSEADGSVTATILADADGSYVTGANSDHTTKLLDNDPPIISVAAVSAEVTEGTDAQFRFSRMGNTRVATRVGLYVGGLPKIMTDATEVTVLTSQDNTVQFYGAWVDYILEFAAGETEKTLTLTTEADSVNEGDGWLGVRIVQRVANPFSIGTGYAQVLVKDDDIPTVSLTQPVGPTGLTLSADGTTWEGQIVEGGEFTYSSVCTGVTEFSEDQRNNLVPLSMSVLYSDHPAFYGEEAQDRLGNNQAGVRSVGADCVGTTVTNAGPKFVWRTGKRCARNRAAASKRARREGFAIGRCASKSVRRIYNEVRRCCDGSTGRWHVDHPKGALPPHPAGILLPGFRLQ